jgi:hypothetical protein
MLLGIDLTVLPTMVMESGPQTAVVVDNFQNLTGHQIGSSPWLSLTSSDTNVVTISPNNQILAVGIGTASITASYLGYVVSRTIAVTPLSLQISLKGTNAVISWTSNEARLECSAAIGPAGSWSVVTGGIVFANGSNSVTLPVSNQAGFFRLAK